MAAIPPRLSAVCRVEILVANGGGTIPLGIGTEYPFITGATIMGTISPNQPGAISINIDAPFLEGKAMLETPMFDPSNKLMIEMGYPSGVTTGFAVGVINEGSTQLSFSPDGLSGTLAASGVGFNSYMFHKPLPEDGDGSGAVLRLLKTMAERCGAAAFDISENAQGILELVSSNSFHSFVSPYQTIRAICRLCSLQFQFTRVGPDGEQFDEYTFLVRTLEEEVAKPPTRSFVMRGGLLTDDFTYPIISFQPTLIGAMFKGGTDPAQAKATAVYVDSSGKVKKAEADTDSDGLPSDTDKNKKPKPDKDDVEKGVPSEKKLEPKETGVKVEAKAKEGEKAESTVNTMVKATVQAAAPMQNAVINTVGIPDLRGGEKIVVANCGSRFDGTYLVAQYTHTWTGGEIQTSITIQAKQTDTTQGTAPLKVEGKLELD